MVDKSVSYYSTQLFNPLELEENPSFLDQYYSSIRTEDSFAYSGFYNLTFPSLRQQLRITLGN